MNPISAEIARQRTKIYQTNLLTRILREIYPAIENGYNFVEVSIENALEVSEGIQTLRSLEYNVVHEFNKIRVSW
jgi:hypothetical protein